MKCVICENEIHPNPLNGYAGGNNAWPIAEGQCCDNCDNKVLVERIKQFKFETPVKENDNG